MAVFRLPFEYPEIQVSLVMDDSISFWILDSGLTRVWGVFRGNDVICGCLWLQEVARKDCSQGEKLCWRTIYSILPDHPPCASKRPARGMSVFWTRQVWKVWITCCSWPNKCISVSAPNLAKPSHGMFGLFPDMTCVKRVYKDNKASFNWSGTKTTNDSCPVNKTRVNCR